MGDAAHPHIDVRTLALRAFRDQTILPLAPRLYMRLATPNGVLENVGYLEAWRNQRCAPLSPSSARTRADRPMLLVLAFRIPAPAPHC